MVSVPVLSELIRLVAPSVSTSVRFLTTALASASCRAPNASIAWTKVGRPEGIAEMPIEIPSSITVARSCPRTSPITTMIATAVQAITPRILVSESSSRCRGDRCGAIADSIDAICPICVRIPVSVTTIVAVPRVTEVFWKSMLLRSPRASSTSVSAAGSFGIGALSPVSAASCVSSVAARTRRPSAGTKSPASSCTMSPGTSCAAGTSTRTPPRTTRACGT